jgi:hypothetical protein
MALSELSHFLPKRFRAQVVRWSPGEGDKRVPIVAEVLEYNEQALYALLKDVARNVIPRKCLAGCHPAPRVVSLVIQVFS